jgi:ketosteroid isomerase-like protein
MTPEEFLRSYEAALVTHSWAAVEPLVHPDVAVTFSNGTHRGKAEVEAAFRANFTLIADETYAISDVHWVARDERYAVCLYTFAWSGIIDGVPAQGGGRGTCVLKKEQGVWLLLTEHLGRHAR